MPYVNQTRRQELDTGAQPETAGDLAYILTRCVDRFIARGETRFEQLAQATAALEATKLELYRRAIAPYEDEKLAQNGDVYTLDEQINDLCTTGE